MSSVGIDGRSTPKNRYRSICLKISHRNVFQGSKRTENADVHLLNMHPLTVILTPATMWSWISPLSGVPSLGTKYWKFVLADQIKSQKGLLFRTESNMIICSCTVQIFLKSSKGGRETFGVLSLHNVNQNSNHLCEKGYKIQCKHSACVQLPALLKKNQGRASVFYHW